MFPFKYKLFILFIFEEVSCVCATFQVLLENQLEMERMRVEAERKKVTLVHEQLREKVNDKFISYQLESFCFVNHLLAEHHCRNITITIVSTN